MVNLSLEKQTLRLFVVEKWIIVKVIETVDGVGQDMDMSRIIKATFF